MATVSGPSFMPSTSPDGLPKVCFWAKNDKTGEVRKTTFDPGTGMFTETNYPTAPPGSPFSMRVSAMSPSCSADSDGDGLPNMMEDVLRTSSAAVDTDKDGVDDGTEVALGSSPTGAKSIPEDLAIQGACSDGVDGDRDGLVDAKDLGCMDRDGDGVSDARDNCVGTANADQTDTDADGFGAACDSDDDFDGVRDDKDLCPKTTPGEAIDGLGCGIDSDLDGVCNPGTSGPGCTGEDACPGYPNPDLQDAMGRTLAATPCPSAMPAPTPTMEHVDTMRLLDH